MPAGTAALAWLLGKTITQRATHVALYSIQTGAKNENAENVETTVSVKLTKFKWNPWSKINIHQLRWRPYIFKWPFYISCYGTGKSVPLQYSHWYYEILEVDGRSYLILYIYFTTQNQDTSEGDTHLIVVHINSNQKNKFRQEKAAAEVFVNCRSSALNFTEEPECENAHGEANQRNNYS